MSAMESSNYHHGMEQSMFQAMESWNKTIIMYYKFSSKSIIILNVMHKLSFLPLLLHRLPSPACPVLSVACLSCPCLVLSLSCPCLVLALSLFSCHAFYESIFAMLQRHMRRGEREGEKEG